MLRILVTVFVFALAVTPSWAQTPRLTNANMRPVASSGALTAQFKALVDAQVEPAWIAYTQPVVDGTLVSCCYGWTDNGGGQTCCVGCPLEGRKDVVSVTDQRSDEGAAAPSQPIKLEGATHFVMLFRIENKRVDRVRVYSADCALDAGGLTVHAITGVKASDSLALLESLATTWPVTMTTSRRSVPDSVVMGVALHRDPAADGVLKKLVEPSQPDDVRRRATFWLARARGRAGFETVRRLMRDDPSERVRKHAVNAIAQSREPEAVQVLIEAARTSPQADVRGEALFWLGQRAGKQAEATITSAIEQDPDTQVKVRAVQALGQLPKDEAVPLLINVAKTNTNPAVRKRAMQWLGQSKDPRAIDFFETVLK